ncbi:unnamed protein product [Caenorhabditis angaria]|uniref:Uncharacterized protein n=1 Tax=Caenorhabditis angaria TaxID=860376 RepID=A0A9P1I578_9PELO|nr:unnamed protein product [Caenorhabditis angaria]
MSFYPLIYLLLFFNRAELIYSTQQLDTFCLQPFVPENAHVIFNEPGPYAKDTVAKYSCALGFDLIGSEERTCLSDGSWSDEPPICAIDVSFNKPVKQSSGNVVLTLGTTMCTMTNDEHKSYWEVDLLGEYSVRSISIRLGPKSSPIISVEAILKNGMKQQCITDSSLFTINSTTSLSCSYDDISRIRITATRRLHLCQVNIYAVNAVSPWQCAQSQMEVIGVFGGMCYAASRDEQTDWLGAQRKCLDRGSTLPLRIDELTRRGLRSTLTASSTAKAFYWIGASSSLTEWRWVDGESVGDKADWPSSQIPTPALSEAVLLARPLDWKWVPASQTAWNAFICQSKPKFCTSPGVGESTKVTFSSHSYAIGTLCFYSCDSGYELHGVKQRECGENGRWTGSIPNCYKRSCGAIRSWKYGRTKLLNKTTLYQSSIEYECSIGWHLTNSASRSTRRICQEDGNWSGNEPTCEMVDCGKPQTITNGRVEVDSTTYESIANYSCHPGYRLIGPDTLVCGDRAEWTPSVPFCYDIATLQEIKGAASHEHNNPNNTTDGNIALAVLAVLLVGCLVVAVLKLSRTSINNHDLSISRDKLNCSNAAIYATPSIQTQSQHPDSVIYYAPTVAHMEVPPHLLQLQQLPNGNIHVTLPIGRQMTRPSLPIFSTSISPTPSQILYSFDHEPIYDVPPDHTECIYERMPERPAPPIPIRGESGKNIQ